MMLTRELQAGLYPPQADIILLKEAGGSSNPGKGTEGEKLRLPGDLVVAKVRKGIPNY